MVYLRAAGLWMSLALSALVPAAANAQTGPSVPMAYCAGINTSPNAASKLVPVPVLFLAFFLLFSWLLSCPPPCLKYRPRQPQLY